MQLLRKTNLQQMQKKIPATCTTNSVAKACRDKKKLKKQICLIQVIVQ